MFEHRASLWVHVSCIFELNYFVSNYNLICSFDSYFTPYSHKFNSIIRRRTACSKMEGNLTER